MLLIIAILSAAANSPLVVATWTDPEAERTGLVADVIEQPAGTTAEEYAVALVEAEGLIPWNPGDPTPGSTSTSGIAYRARYAGDGHEVVVYFSPDGTAVSRGRLCRVRRPRGGATDVHYRAVRWCHASLGVTLPTKRPSPIAGQPVRVGGLGPHRSERWET